MKKEPTPDVLLAVIRAHCLECSGGSRKQVHNCEITHCRLWPYRKAEQKKYGKKNKKTNENRQLTIFDLIECEVNSEIH